MRHIPPCKETLPLKNPQISGFPQQELTIQHPKSDEELIAGSIYSIQWDSYGSISDIKLEFSDDNGSTWELIGTNISNTGSYQWQVPHVDSEQCLVKITDVDDPSVFNISNGPFEISISYPMLVFPNGGETIQTGTTYPIQWNTIGVINNILVEYSTDNGNIWSEVSPPNVGNTGSYNWLVPYELSNQCLVRVSDANYPAAFDVSNNVFEITASYPRLTAPNGGEELVTGITYPVTWRTAGSIDEIVVEYSLDNGLNWRFVDPNNAGNADAYLWNVPPVFSDESLMRLSDKDYPAVSDSSDNVFRINTLDLLSPNGKESILAGSTYDIKWRYSPLIVAHQIKLEYSFNNGAVWLEIAAADNDGRYEWHVPNIESNQYLIRITDVEDARGFDQSRDTFKVYSCRVAIPGDINGDCVVDLFDFCILSQNWLMQGYIEFYRDSLDTNPLWQTEGEWAYGEPQGQGGTAHGYPDPNSGFTGANVYGVNLNGDYSTDIGGPYYLTAGPFYCKHYRNIILKFARRLNIDQTGYAEAQVQVSSDNTTWTTLWTNAGVPLTDNAWNIVEYDVGSIADGAETVYIRWSYEIFDHAHAYSGWNLDDLGLWGNPK